VEHAASFLRTVPFGGLTYLLTERLSYRYDYRRRVLVHCVTRVLFTVGGYPRVPKIRFSEEILQPSDLTEVTVKTRALSEGST